MSELEPIRGDLIALARADLNRPTDDGEGVRPLSNALDGAERLDRIYSTLTGHVVLLTDRRLLVQSSGTGNPVSFVAYSDVDEVGVQRRHMIDRVVIRHRDMTTKIAGLFAAERDDIVELVTSRSPGVKKSPPRPDAAPAAATSSPLPKAPPVGDPVRIELEALARVAQLPHDVRWTAVRTAAAALEAGERPERFVAYGWGGSVLLVTDRRLILDGGVESVLYADVHRVDLESGWLSGRVVVGHGQRIEKIRVISAEEREALMALLRLRCPNVTEPPAEPVPAPATTAPVVADAPAPAPAEEVSPDDIPTFDVHALGPSGAGKTVFMASLYHRLRIRRPELAFYLRSDHASSQYLNAVHNRLADTDDRWPDSSQGTHEWEFTTCIQSATGDFEPARFRYLDYPGGVLTNPHATRDASVQDLVGRLRSANALLVLLDGQAMLSLLTGDPYGRRYLSFELTSSLELAQQSRCPVHFVVTKWDLLAGRFELAQLRDTLMDDENFGDLVSSKAEDTPAAMRLLPVSAVGYEFAAPDPSGAMRKTGGRLRPAHVEVPFLSVLPDFLRFAGREMAAQPPAPTPVPLTGPALRGRLVGRIPQLGRIPARYFDDAATYGGRWWKATNGEPEQAPVDLLQSRRAVDSERAALDLLTRQCEQVVAAFERDHPASVLHGGLDALAS